MYSVQCTVWGLTRCTSDYYTAKLFGVYTAKLYRYSVYSAKLYSVYTAKLYMCTKS